MYKSLSVKSLSVNTMYIGESITAIHVSNSDQYCLDGRVKDCVKHD